jgi:hypothetical protein
VYEAAGGAMKLGPILVVVLAVPALATAKPPTAGRNLVGTWRLVSTRQTMTDGSVRSDPDLGDHPAGYMMYDRSGRMCTLFSNSDRPRWLSSGPTETEARALFDQMVVYCARYRVDAAAGKILFDMEFGHSPALAGVTRERKFELVGDRLTLHPTPLPAGVTTWSVNLKRVSR